MNKYLKPVVGFLVISFCIFMGCEKKEEKGTNYPILMEYGGLMAREDCDGVSGLKKLGGEIVSLDRINKILHERFKVD